MHSSSSACRVFRSLYVRCVTLVSPITIALFCGPSCLPEDSLTLPNSATRGQAKVGPSGDGESASSDDDEEAGEGAMALFKLDWWLQLKMDIQVNKAACYENGTCELPPFCHFYNLSSSRPFFFLEIVALGTRKVQHYTTIWVGVVKTLVLGAIPVTLSRS